jgi:uncharacterized phage protein gp47/JayE
VTSPDPIDLTGYLPLELVPDTTAQELVDRAVANRSVRAPEWDPHEEQTESVLVEDVAQVDVELVYAVNRVFPTVVEVLLRLFDLERDPGAPPLAAVTFTTSNVGPIRIPVGTAVRVPLPGGGTIAFVTDVDLDVAAAGTATVAATGDLETTAANGIATATPVELLSAVPYVESATVTITTGGRDLESSTVFLNRGVRRFRRLTDTLNKPSHYLEATLEDPRVVRAFVLDKYDPATPGTPAGTKGGHLTVAVTGPGGIALSAPVKTELELMLETAGHAGWDVHVIDATVTVVNVVANVIVTAGYVAADVKLAVAAAVRAYLSPDSWPFGGTVYVNEVESVVDRVDGVDRVASVTLNGAGADVALAGVAPLAKAGTVNVP